MMTMGSHLDLWVTERDETKGFGVTYRVLDTLHTEQSPFQRIDVVRTQAMGRMLLLDGCIMTTEKDETTYHEVISHTPLFALPRPARRVLIVGGGDGGVIREVLKHPSVEEVVLCEIDERVVRVSQEHLPGIASKVEDPRVTLKFEDAVAYVAQAADATFDVVIVDSTDPVSIGEGLFTRAFYGNVRRILTEDGIMVCQSDAPYALTEQWRKVLVKVRSQFEHVFPYVAPIPTYPGGYWAWTMACKQAINPTLPCVAREDVPALLTEIETKTRYYHRAMHQAMFVLPNQLQKLACATLQETPPMVVTEALAGV
jgi:spermidine synthase